MRQGVLQESFALLREARWLRSGIWHWVSSDGERTDLSLPNRHLIEVPNTDSANTYLVGKLNYSNFYSMVLLAKFLKRSRTS